MGRVPIKASVLSVSSVVNRKLAAGPRPKSAHNEGGHIRNSPNDSGRCFGLASLHDPHLNHRRYTCFLRLRGPGAR